MCHWNCRGWTPTIIHIHTKTKWNWLYEHTTIMHSHRRSQDSIYSVYLWDSNKENIKEIHRYNHIESTPKKYINGHCCFSLGPPTNVQVVSSIFYASFDNWFTIKSVLRGQTKQRENCCEQCCCHLSSTKCHRKVSFASLPGQSLDNILHLQVPHSWESPGLVGTWWPAIPVANDFNVCPQLQHSWQKRGKEITFTNCTVDTSQLIALTWSVVCVDVRW